MSTSPDPENPAKLRAMFGANLRQLSEGYTSISELARQLGINRTQYNRYITGESFPRPDVLARICAFFKVDARVLLEPLETLGEERDPLMNPHMRDFLGPGTYDVSENYLPSGFYRFSRRSFHRADQFFMSIVMIHRRGLYTYMRGFESRQAMQEQHLPADGPTREFRGLVMRQDDGVSIMASRRNSFTASFSYLHRVTAIDNNYLAGYATRSAPETPDIQRAARMVFEYLGPSVSAALPAARATGFYGTDALPNFHRRLLSPDKPFF